MKHNTNTPAPAAAPTPAEILAFLGGRPSFAFDREFLREELARAQERYTLKRKQVMQLRWLLEDGTPDIIVRGVDGREVVIRFADANMPDVRGGLTETLEKELGELERDIVKLHADIEEDDSTRIEGSDYDRYTTAVEALLTAAPQPSPITTPPTGGSTMWVNRGTQAA